MRKWQSQRIKRDLDQAVAGLDQATRAGDPVSADFWLEASLEATRAGLTRAQQRQVDTCLRQFKRLKGYM